MTERITMQVARYRPEVETDASFQEYEVPCPKDWVVLEGLKPGDAVIVDNLVRMRPGAPLAPTAAAKKAS